MSASNKTASRSQLLQLAGMLAQNLPADLPRDVAQAWIDDPEGVQEILAALRHQSAIEVAKQKFQVMVDPSLNWTEFVWKVKRYFHFDDGITSNKFSKFVNAAPHMSVFKAEVVAICFGSVVSIKKALRLCKRFNLKGIRLEHFVALCEKYSDQLRKLGGPVVIPNYSVEIRTGNSVTQRGLALQQGDDNEKTWGLLEVYDFENRQWGANTWFLGLPE